MTQYVKVTLKTDLGDRKKRAEIKERILSLFGKTGFTAEEIVSLVSEMLLPVEVVARNEGLPPGFVINMVYEEINKVLANHSVVMAGKKH